MLEPLRVLLLEDNPDDAELVLRELRRTGFEPDWQRVETEGDFLDLLQPELDIILSDYDMPTFSGTRALELLQQTRLDIPFIIISGTIGEDVAVDVMKLGATDYLLKDRLVRLGIAVRQAIEQGKLRRDRTRAAEALQKSEHDLRALAEELEIERARLVAAQAVAKMGSWETDLTTMKVIWSAETYRIFEVSPDQFEPTHHGFMYLAHPDDREAVDLALSQSLTRRSVSSIEHRLLMPDGRIKFVKEQWQVFHDEQGRPKRALGTCHDITDHKQADEELRWKTAFLEAQVNATPDGIIILDQQGRKILQNQRTTDLFKVPTHLAENKDDSGQLEWVTNMMVDPVAFVERVHHLYAHPDEIGREEIELKDGTVLDRYSSPVVGKDGKHYGRIWAFRDITDRKSAATALMESKRFLQSTLNALTSHIAILDEHGTIIEVNAAWNRFARENDFKGTCRGVGDNYLQLCDSSSGKDSAEAVLVAAGIRAVMAAQRDEFHLEYPCHSPREQRWFVVRITRFDGDGPMRVVVAHENITERKLAEEAMSESEERFRQLAENIQEVFWISDSTKQHLIYVSPAYEAIWGRTSAALYESPQGWLDAIHPDDRERVLKAALTQQLNGTYDEEYRILRPDESMRWIRDRAFPVQNLNGETYRVVGVARDVSERKLAEVQVKEQASLLDKARDAILVRDLEHGITYWNKSAEQLYGWTSAEALGRKASQLLYNDLTAYEKAVEAVIRLGEWHGELQQINRAGDPLLVEARWTLVRDDAGRPQSILAINSDITEKKKLEQQYLRVQRMESIGTLAGGIAHDLNNVLAPILMSIELLRMTSRDQRAQSVLGTIEASAKRGADMVQQILSFARGVEGERVTILPRQIIEEIQNLVQDTFPKNITFQAELPSVLPAFVGDHTQIHQVLLNLCVNARDAMPDGGVMTVAASNIIVDEQYAATHANAKPGSYVMITVTDTGTGIPPQVIEKIFDPFFTTKELGRGTGLGLSTVLAIVKSHDGFISVHSEQGMGTTFTVCFPASVSSATGELIEVQEPNLRGQGELILVVDDEAAVRTITQQTLEAFGYRVRVAADGTEAVAIYTEHQSDIAVVLTDMMMPILDGPGTIQVLKHLNPAVKIIAASGLSNDGGALRAAGMGVKHFLPKPYTANTVLTVLREVLEEP